VPLLFSLILLVASLTTFFSDYISTPVTLVICVLLFAFVMGLIFVLIIIERRRIKTQRYVIDKDNIHAIGAMFGVSRITKKLSGITSMQIKQSILGGLMNYGNIEIDFFGGGQLIMENIKNPDEVLTKIENFMKKNK